jgi:hypothetical protein
VKLLILEHGRYKVVAKVESGDLPVLSFLKEVPAQMQGSAKGFLPLFRRYAESGRQKLTSAVFHEADINGNIWQFIKGRLRVYCFMDEEGSILILSHGAIKKSQKPDPLEIKKAKRLRDAYVEARNRDELEWRVRNEQA